MDAAPADQPDLFKERLLNSAAAHGAKADWIGSLTRRGSAAAAMLHDPGLGLGARAVVDRHLVAGTRQPADHGPAHPARADDGDRADAPRSRRLQRAFVRRAVDAGAFLIAATSGDPSRYLGYDAIYLNGQERDSTYYHSWEEDLRTEAVLAECLGGDAGAGGELHVEVAEQQLRHAQALGRSRPCSRAASSASS